MFECLDFTAFIAQRHGKSRCLQKGWKAAILVQGMSIITRLVRHIPCLIHKLCAAPKNLATTMLPPFVAQLPYHVVVRFSEHYNLTLSLHHATSPQKGSWVMESFHDQNSGWNIQTQTDLMPLSFWIRFPYRLHMLTPLSRNEFAAEPQRIHSRVDGTTGTPRPRSCAAPQAGWQKGKEVIRLDQALKTNMNIQKLPIDPHSGKEIPLPNHHFNLAKGNES